MRAALLAFVCFTAALRAETVVWRFTPDAPARLHLTTLGHPHFGSDRATGREFARFDGQHDAFLAETNPLAGWKDFAIVVVLRPDPAGPEEQRFLALQSTNAGWLTLETRVDHPGATWSLDTYLKGPSDRRTLLDRALRHPCAGWHTAELRYHHGRMSSAVDGQDELSGPVAFPVLGPGRLSIGVRLNRVYWYQGDIAEVRFVRL